MEKGRIEMEDRKEKEGKGKRDRGGKGREGNKEEKEKKRNGRQKRLSCLAVRLTHWRKLVPYIPSMAMIIIVHSFLY
jgi:hypothetical protein